MYNVFKPYHLRHSQFSFGRMGDIDRARDTLGPNMPVAVYRLMLFTIIDTLESDLGAVPTRHMLHEAGRLAGSELAMHRLRLEDAPGDFMKSFGALYAELKIGHLQVERYDPVTREVVLLVENHLAGAPPAAAKEEEDALHFDMGFFAGVMEAYTGLPFAMERAYAPNGAQNGRQRYTGRPA